MHADEVHTDVELVRRLLAEQFPEWAELPVEPVRFFGRHNAGRGGPLALRDEPCRNAISALAGEIDAAAATAVWEEALAAPEWSREPVLLHGDLDARNLLVTDGRLSGLVDFGTLGTGDPA